MIKNSIKIRFIQIIYNFFLFNLISCEIDECPRETPIKKGNECLSTYCSELQFESKDCIISNSIIKTQWLNNIILVGEKDFRFVNLISSLNGELLLSTSSSFPNRDRIYFGIDPIGNPIFNDKSIIKKSVVRNVRNNNIYRYESQPGLIKINDDNKQNKEYFINIGINKTYTEIFDYINYENNLIEIDYSEIIDINIKSFYGSLINIFENDKNYYILAVISSQNNFIIRKLNFYYDTNGDISCKKEVSKSFNSQENRIVSCYKTNENIIICVYVNENGNYKIIAFKSDLESLNSIELKFVSPSIIVFFKLIYLKNDYGLFCYYQGIDNDYPSIQILETKYNGCTYYINLKNNIKLNEYFFNNFAMLTDIIKILDKVYLVSTSQNKEILIIILINFYNDLDYNIRYYLINIFELYKFKFLSDISISVYNNNLALAFSFCSQKICNNDEDEHYTSLILFSYPHVINSNLDIINYLNDDKNNEIIINLSNNVIIDNNVFGFIFHKIKIYSIDLCGIDFISNKTNKTIQKNDILEKNEFLILNFTLDKYKKRNCSISFSPIITEPDYENYNKYPNYTLNENNENEKSKFVNHFYEGKKGYLNIIINQNITKNCGTNCNLCLQKDKSFCLSCKYDFDFINNKKICFDKINDDCNVENVIKGKCSEKILKNKEIKGVYTYIKEEILKDNSTYKNIYIPTGNVQFQVTTLKEQKSPNTYISSIDLNNCGKILKEHYNISDEDLIKIFKIDTKTNDSLTTYVQYEVYDPTTIKQLNLSYCDESEIIINVPVNLDSETINLYNSLNQSGYNLFDPNDKFYNEICTPYTSIYNTDMILLDRKNLIYVKNGNKALCQNNCSFIEYKTNYKNAVCQCKVEKEMRIPKLHEIKSKFNRTLIKESFLITLKNSNFQVLKCYKLVFNFGNILKNIGMIIMTIILLASIILFFICYFNEQKKINNFIDSILKIKFFSKNLKPLKRKVTNSKTKEKNSNKIIQINQKNKIKKKIESKPKLKNNKYKLAPPKKSYNKLQLKLKQKTKKTLSNNFNSSDLSGNNFIKKEWIKELKSTKASKIIKTEKLNDEELNNLDYEKALQKDKRTYLQYYYSLLKKKQLILFTFITKDDYNLLTIKISLFLFSFSLSFTINGFFFSDDTMHKIYEDYGAFNFLYHITQVIYSTLVCAVINIILKQLSLSEKNILKIKKQKDLAKSIEISKKIKKCINIKFLIFFILSLIFLLFFWYFISCFCIVYNNTQIILIKDTLISFGLSMIYPFGLNLLPGIFRIPALRAKNKDKKCLYTFSLIVALI